VTAHGHPGSPAVFHRERPPPVSWPTSCSSRVHGLGFPATLSISCLARPRVPVGQLIGLAVTTAHRRQRIFRDRPSRAFPTIRGQQIPLDRPGRGGRTNHFAGVGRQASSQLADLGHQGLPRAHRVHRGSPTGFIRCRRRSVVIRRGHSEPVAAHSGGRLGPCGWAAGCSRCSVSALRTRRWFLTGSRIVSDARHGTFVRTLTPPKQREAVEPHKWRTWLVGRRGRARARNPGAHPRRIGLPDQGPADVRPSPILRIHVHQQGRRSEMKERWPPAGRGVGARHWVVPTSTPRVPSQSCATTANACLAFPPGFSPFTDDGRSPSG